MPLLLAYRRWWSLIFLAVLLLPTLGLVLPDMPAPLRLATRIPPGWWIQPTAQMDPFINSNFGFRGVVMAGNAAFTRATRSTRSRPVLIGEHGQLFYTGDKALDQSLGQLFRPQAVHDFVDVLTRLDRRLKAAGITLVVGSPPNGATILPDKLPEWARAQMRRPTELDAVAEGLSERGVTFLDLRPILTAARAHGPIYRLTDSHWNEFAAVLAFNAAMKAAGRSDLQIDPDEANGPPRPSPTGDLSRYLGEASPTGDIDYPKLLTKPDTLVPLKGLMPVRPDNDPFQPFAYATGKAGPSVLVIGDSFTQGYWPRFLAARTSRFAWMHHASCRFEADAIDRFKPDIVFYMPTERSIPCKGQPSGM